ncbi:MAG: redoxin domain-containing protein [Chitinophagaceae bacterium]|nr:redoxin domain-containing protein [Chitinophagaceae bacterium]
MQIKIGQKAPEFSLYDSERNKVSLSDFKGKNVLILFYPQAFSSTCTEELCTVRDDIGRYSNAQAQVLGISVDSIFTLKRYRDEQGYNFPLLSDFNKEVSRAYDSLFENWIFDMKGVSKRTAFIIDKEGMIQYTELVESKDGVPDFEAINKRLEELN